MFPNPTLHGVGMVDGVNLQNNIPEGLAKMISLYSFGRFMPLLSKRSF